MNSFKFKYNHEIYRLKDPIIIDIFKLFKSVDEFCMYYNLLKHYNHLSSLLPSDYHTIMRFRKQLLSLKRIKCIDNGFLISQSKTTILTINIIEERKISHHRELLKLILSKYRKEDLSVKKDIFLMISQSPNMYLKEYHEDYVYSDDNWSYKDASL